MLRPMLYTAKCYWPGVTEDELRLAATRAATGTGATSGDEAVDGDRECCEDLDHVRSLRSKFPEETLRP